MLVKQKMAPFPVFHKSKKSLYPSLEIESQQKS